MSKTSQASKVYKKWYFWIGIVVMIVLIITIMVVSFNTERRITICVKRDYSSGSLGECIEEQEVEIVASPEKQQDCPVGTEPVSDVVGGIVGIRFVGCAKSR